MAKRIDEMTREEFVAHMKQRARKILAKAEQCDVDAAHWNSQHPDETTLPTDAMQQVRDLLHGKFG